MDKIKFNTAFSALVKALRYEFKDESDLKQTKAVYFEYLSQRYGFDDDKFQKSVNYLISNFDNSFGRKFPTVRDFLNASGDSPDIKANKALSIVRKAIKRAGQYKTIAWGKSAGYRAIGETIESLGGWPKVCCDLNDNDFKNVFIKNYMDGMLSESHTYSIGQHDLNNGTFSSLYRVTNFDVVQIVQNTNSDTINRLAKTLKIKQPAHS
jgi:hypothetical protein